MTVWVPRFFHQCEVRNTSGLISPALCKMGLRAIAGVFNDLALLHKNESGPIVVAVPWHDAAGLDRQLAEAQLAVLEVRRLLFEVDRTQSHVGYADRLEFDFLSGVRHHPARRAIVGGI